MTSEDETPATLDELLARLRALRRADPEQKQAVIGRVPGVGVSFQAVSRWENGLDRPKTLARLRGWIGGVGAPEEWVPLYEALHCAEQVNKALVAAGIDDESRSAIRTIVVRGTYPSSRRDGLQRRGATASGS